MDAAGARPPRLELVAYVVAARDAEPPCPDEVLRRLAERLPAYMVPARVVVLDAFPRLPNGKVDVASLPAATRHEATSVSGPAPPDNARQQALLDIWKALLGVELLGVDDNFFEVGGDSLIAIQVVSKARQAGFWFTVGDLFDRPTVAALAAGTDDAVDATAAATPAPGSGPLTPIQHWFFEQGLDQPHHWNQSVLIDATEPLDMARVRLAIDRLVGRHAALRTRFIRRQGVYRQEEAEASWVFRTLAPGAISASTDAAAVVSLADELHQTLDLAAGRLLAVGHVDRGPGTAGQLLLVAHHLAVDAVSWRILLEDLDRIYDALRTGATIAPPPGSTSFLAYSAHLTELAQTGVFDDEVPFWQEQASGSGAAIPRDDTGINDVASAGLAVVSLDRAATDRLTRALSAHGRTGPADVLLASLAQSLAEWAGGAAVRLDVEGHGRRLPGASSDLSQTVGWCTTVFPLTLRTTSPDDVGAWLEAVKATMGALPWGGIGHGALLHLTTEAARATRLRCDPPTEVVFNYLGQMDRAAGRWFRVRADDLGRTRAPRDPRRYLLEVNTCLRDGCLEVRLGYSRAVHRPETIARLSQRMLALVEELPGRLERPSRATEDVLPLTPAQQLMLVHSLSARGEDALISQLVFALPGDVDETRLERAWREVVARHGQLRASFEWRQVEQPVQTVHAQAELEWTVHDWRADSPHDAARRRTVWLDDDRRRDFDLTRAPLMRVALLKMAAGRLELVWTSHHLVLDRWCVDTVRREVEAWYGALTAGRTPALPPAGAWRAFVNWLRTRDREADLRFWRPELAGVRHALDLPGTGAATAPASWVEAHATLPPSRVAALRTWASPHGLSPGTVVLGLWSLALARVSRQSAFLVGVTVSGRPPDLPDIDHTIGSFVATLPLRVDIASAPPLDRWLRDLQRRLLTLQDHAHVSPIDLHACSDLPADRPLFDVLLVHQGAERRPDADAPPALEWRAVAGSLTSALPLVIATSEDIDGLTSRLSSRAGVVSDALRQQLLREFDTLAATLAADPAATLTAIPTDAGGAERRAGASGPAGADDRPHPVPRNGVEAALVPIWAHALGHSRFDVGDNFFDLGGTSLQALDLMARVQDRFGRGIPFAALLEAPTIRGLAARIDAPGAARSWTSLVPIQPEGLGRPLFLVHHGGGSSFGYPTLARCLGTDVPVYAFHEPGLEAGEERLPSIEALAATYIADLRTVQPTGPYRLGGFCFGGVVAFEMAQQLTRAGEQVEWLALIDAAVPSLCQPAPFRERRRWYADRLAGLTTVGKLTYLARRIGRRVRVEATNRATGIRLVTLRGLYRAYRRLGLPEPRYLRTLDLLHYNGDLSLAYRPEPYHGRVLLVRSDRPDLPVDFGWNAVVDPGVEIWPMPGEDHLSMLVEPHVWRLADGLRAGIPGDTRGGR
jgi:non-ribosomal peptide synthase protein (TIGR01720 family)